MMQRVAFSAVAVALLALAGYLTLGQGARATGTDPDAMSIDMEPASSPANTATGLGSRQACARINENNILDADEDSAADTLSVDVTVTNIPASNPMITFTYALNYNETQLTVQTQDSNFLLFANNGRTDTRLDASEVLPDTNNDGVWNASVIDIELDTPQPESGSGVLSRLTISSDSGAVAGTYPLTLTEAAVIDPQNPAANQPDTIDNASIAVNQACPLVHGDVDCSDGASPVGAVDALKILRKVVNLPVTQNEPCPDIGTGGPPVQGNVDCSTVPPLVSAIDALKILRKLVNLPVAQELGCPDIGT